MTMPTTDELLTAISAHLAAFELPPIALVLVTAAISAPQVTVQLAGHEPRDRPGTAGLGRTDTLIQVTAPAGGSPEVSRCTRR